MIENAFIIAMIVLFLNSTTWEGMIFENINKILKPKWKISSPIYNCPICMTPWWGTLIYWLFIGISCQDWLFVVGCASGINVISVILMALRNACVLYIKNNDSDN